MTESITGWHAHQPAARSKTAQTRPDEALQPGDLVHDREEPEPDDAIVVNQPPTTATEWEVDARDCTPADDNPDYPPDAAVAVVCFAPALSEDGPAFDPTEREPLALETLQEAGVHCYIFPAPRLAVIESPATGLPATTTDTTDDETTSAPATTAGDGTAATDPPPVTDHPGTVSTDTTESDETGLSSQLQALKTTLEDDGLTVEITDAETLTVDRLGQTYTISPDGAIEGDGALRAQLEAIVGNAT